MRSCGTCDFYVGINEANAARAAAIGVVVRGRCQRFPVEVAKRPDDWCGEFSAIVPAPAEKVK